MLTVVLVEPQIPPNTGTIARLCAATESRLHLVGPLGFDLSDKALKRAGLDYWPYVDVTHFPDTEAYMSAIDLTKSHLLTTKATRTYTDRQFLSDDYLFFGSETKGLSETYLARYASNTCTIPMSAKQKGVRSLNLATAVGIVLYEAIRQCA